MPVLPYTFYSNYYLLEIYYLDFFASLGINCGFSAEPGKILCSRFSVNKMIDASEDHLTIQGLPGAMIKNEGIGVYEYTIEAPLIIWGKNDTNLFPYNSLNYLALNLMNLQWQNLHGDNTNIDLDVFFEDYSISVQTNAVMQTLKIKSNILLDSTNIDANGRGLQLIARTLNTNETSFINNFGRLVKNYDIFVDAIFKSSTEEYYLQTQLPYISATQQLYLDDANFGVKFIYTEPVYINTDSKKTFMLSSYNMTQSYGIVGFADKPAIETLEPGIKDEFLLKNTISLAGIKLIEYYIPFIIKSKNEELKSNSLIKTTLDISNYGLNYDPTNSIYGRDFINSSIS